MFEDASAKGRRCDALEKKLSKSFHLDSLKATPHETLKREFKSTLSFLRRADIVVVVEKGGRVSRKRVHFAHEEKLLRGTKRELGRLVVKNARHIIIIVVEKGRV